MREMISVSAKAVCAAASLCLASLQGASAQPDQSFERTEDLTACDDYDALRRPFFGETHLHTSYSFDAYNLNARNTPDIAYDFAKGAEVMLPPYDAREGSPQTRTVSSENPTAPIVNSVELVDTGVILQVTPTVNTGGLVSLRVVQEVSQAITTSTSDIDSPTIQTRKIESTLAVQSGETVALAGLMDKRREHADSGVPGLKKIPVLGNLFKKKVKKDDRTELIVLITPKVVRDPGEMRAVTDELRTRLPNVSTF